MEENTIDLVDQIDITDTVDLRGLGAKNPVRLPRLEDHVLDGIEESIEALRPTEA